MYIDVKMSLFLGDMKVKKKKESFEFGQDFNFGS